MMITNIIGGLVAATVALTSAAHVVDKPSGNNYAVSVGTDEKRLDLSALPCDPYYDGEYMMVPLRAVAEALGYKVSYNEATGEITVDDYIQSATLKNGSATVTFKGHLQVINMSRDITLPVRTAIIGGHAYVPADFFTEFFNEVKVENGVVTIPVNMSEVAKVSKVLVEGGRHARKQNGYTLHV